jgi:hypothetical protein
MSSSFQRMFEVLRIRKKLDDEDIDVKESDVKEIDESIEKRVDEEVDMIDDEIKEISNYEIEFS